MEKNQFRLMARSVVSTSVVIFILSFEIGKIISLFFLSFAVIGMIEIFILGLKYSKSWNAKLLHLVLLLLFCGRWFMIFECPQVASCFYIAVLLLGAFFVLRGAFYLNKYCGPNAESKLDEL